MWQNIIHFLQTEEARKPTSSKLIAVLSLFFIGLLFHLFFAIGKFYLKQLGYVASLSHSTVAAIREETDIFTLILIFLSSSLLHPFMEELAYRLVVVPTRQTLAFGIGSLITLFTLTTSRIYQRTPFGDEVSYDVIFFASSALIALVLWQLFQRNPNLVSILTRVKPRSWALITSALFAISHINVIPDTTNLLVLIWLLLPFFVNGILISYARVSMGFLFGFLIHALNNSFFYAINALF